MARIRPTRSCFFPCFERPNSVRTSLSSFIRKYANLSLQLATTESIFALHNLKPMISNQIVIKPSPIAQIKNQTSKHPNSRRYASIEFERIGKRNWPPQLGLGKHFMAPFPFFFFFFI
uniref:E3 SUMO-protein ligase SIZ1-like n=1 Tax=Rhizophora mucronata TaxID=61149 RepID=A0A2P2MH87_RHIMU